jgi:hypothetical protein
MSRQKRAEAQKPQPADDQRAQHAYEAAKEAIGNAKAAISKEKADVQIAWAHANQAYRFLLEVTEGPELEAHAAMIRREAEEKLKNWRGEAVRDLLPHKKNPGQRAPAGTEVALARFLLDQHFDNLYFKLSVLANHAGRLPWILGVLLAIVLSLSSRISDNGSFLQTALIMVLGAVGAILSSTLSALGGDSRIPEMLSKPTQIFVRVFFGALSAVAVVAIVSGKVLPIEAPTGNGVYVWAVASGFTDQLLTRMMLMVEKAAEK